MPSKKPRIIITVEPEVNDLLIDLYNLTGTPKATFVSDLLDEALPALFEVRDALRNLEDKKSTLPNVVNMLKLLGESNLKVNTEINEALNQIDWVEDSKDD